MNATSVAASALVGLVLVAFTACHPSGSEDHGDTHGASTTADAGASCASSDPLPDIGMPECRTWKSGDACLSNASGTDVKTCADFCDEGYFLIHCNSADGGYPPPKPADSLGCRLPNILVPTHGPGSMEYCCPCPTR